MDAVKIRCCSVPWVVDLMFCDCKLSTDQFQASSVGINSILTIMTMITMMFLLFLVFSLRLQVLLGITPASLRLFEL